MAVILKNATMSLSFTGVSTQDGDINSKQKDSIVFQRSFGFTQGTSANKAERIWYDSREVLASQTDSLNLANLTDQIGQNIVFTTIKMVIIHNTNAGAQNEIDIDTVNATFPWNRWFDGIITLKGGYNVDTTSGGLLVLGNQDATGFTVADLVANGLDIVNTSAANITYEIFILGDV